MIFKTDPSEIQSYLEDTSALRDGFTAGVFFPETYEDVSTILKQSNQEKIRITISGNGTGTTGGRIPYGGYVISTEKLNRIIRIQKFDDGSGLATVQVGAMLFDLQKAVEESGMLYPPDPTERYCFIGGTIANNSSGARTFKYGATRSFINRIKIAFANGEIFDLPRGNFFADELGYFDFITPEEHHFRFAIPNYVMPQTSKHMAGFYSAPKMDLIDLFIGSEGTLGVILEADLKLVALPEKIFSMLVYFDSDEYLQDFVKEIRDRSSNSSDIISARAIEYFDFYSLIFLRSKYPNIPKSAQGAIFIEQEVTEKNQDEKLQTWYELLEKHHALIDDSWIALSPEEQQSIRDFRHALPVLVNEWYAKFRQKKISTDMAVPNERFLELLHAYRDECLSNQLDYILFGHIGNSHLHLNILPKNLNEVTKAKEIYRGLVKKSIELGGTISAEHGVGKLKAEYLALMFGESGIAEMVRVKKALDPNLILSIGNLIPEKYLTT